jgi:adenine-specific DNA methylase
MAGKKLPLPDFILENKEFMDKFYETQGIKPSAKTKKQRSLASFDEGKKISSNEVESPLADLAWHVRAWGWWVLDQVKKDMAQYYPIIEDKPTVAYFWARTVTCKNCRATIPLLKTMWLCKKDKKRVLLKMQPNESHTS